MAVYWLMTLCSILMMTFAASGLVVYVMVMLILMARKKFSRKSYFLLACWLGVADCICLLLMLSYSAPSIFLGHRLHQSHIFGAVLNIGWFSGLAIILLIAGDRYLCMFTRLITIFGTLSGTVYWLGFLARATLFHRSYHSAVFTSMLSCYRGDGM